MRGTTDNEIDHVVIGIIQNTQQEILVSRRKPDAHLGGLLEFPGGKVESNETALAALQRELTEELNITVTDTTPLIQIPFHYLDRKILLDAYFVNKYSGCVSGHEGQEICWKKIKLLNDNEFPAANYGVIRALQMPERFPITPSYSEDAENFLTTFENVVSSQFTQIIQLRSHELKTTEYLELANQCAELCNKHSVKLILNRDLNVLDETQAAGIHLTGENLLNTEKRPLDKSYLVGASCHNLKEVKHANSLKLDYIFVGPVIEKINSKNTEKLDWDGFAKLSRNSLIPVYAIGGLTSNDLGACVLHGGQGIAAIRDFWNLSA